MAECNHCSFDIVGEDCLQNQKKCENKIKDLQEKEKFSCMEMETEKNEVIKNLTKRVENLEQICEMLIGKIKDLTEFKQSSFKSEMIRISNLNSNHKLSNNNSSKVIQGRTPSNFEFCNLCKSITASSLLNICNNCKIFICLKCHTVCKNCNSKNCLKCSSCKICENNNVCFDCKYSCAQCIKNEIAFCLNCISKCDLCSKSFCKRCCGFKCKQCEKNFCIACCWNCKICVNTFCKETYSDMCTLCGVRICNKCLMVCGICNKNNCTICVQKCDKCQIDSCKRCSIKSKPNSVINTTNIQCKNCISS